MSSYITIGEAQAWAEQTKMPVAEIDPDLMAGVATEVLGKVAGSFDTTTWLDSTNTPSLIRKIMAMEYVGWYIARTYASDEGRSDYGLRLIGMAEQLIAGLRDGSVLLVDDTNPADAAGSTAQFYPTDASSMLEPTSDDMSLGGPVFTMGVIW